MSFREALTVPKFTETENGDPTYGTSSNILVDMYFHLIRGSNLEAIRDYLARFIENNNDYKSLEKLIILLFHIRDIRGGKGERDVFYKSIKILNELSNYNKNAKKLIDTLINNPELIPEYGYYKDINNLFNILPFGRLRKALIDYYAKKLGEEFGSFNLAWKYAPGEKSSNYKELYRVLKKLLNFSSKQYRKWKSESCAKIDLVERKMCSKHFKEIKYSGVPSKAMMNYRNAFKNTTKQGLVRSHEEDRIIAAKNYEKYLEDVRNNKTKINSSTLYPHEMVNKFLYRDDNDETIEAQWNSYVKNLMNKSIAGESVVSLVDVSGSMMGQPMEVSIAMGLLLSQLVDNPLEQPEAPFANLFITFHSNPSIIKLNRYDSLREKIKRVEKSPWGANTNFDRALQLILSRCVDNKIEPENIPKKFFIFSDMQFDSADCNSCNNSWNSRYDRIEKEFSDAGEKAVGRPYQVPTIIFWNLRGDIKTVPEQSNKLGVVLLSGFSPNMLNKIFDNQLGELTPWNMVREILEQPRYKQVADAFSSSYYS